MSFRYNLIQKLSKRFYRKIFPVPKSPYITGAVKDICAVHLVPTDTLRKFFSQYIALLKEVKKGGIGDYLEFGVFNGSSISIMHKIVKEGSLSMRLFGFDAFEGLPIESENEDGGVWKKGFYNCSFEQMQKCLRKENINPAEIIWIKGWYNKTLTPEIVKQYAIVNLGIVFIDCDTYSSSKSVLDFIGPLITSPCILCFDDWKLNDLDIKGMGEYKSFNEFLDVNTHLKAKEISSHNRKSKCFLVSPK